MSRTRKILDDNRVFSRAPMSEQSADQHREALAHHIDAPLRELLEYCDRQRVGNPNADQAITWGRAGALVQKILDGEPVTEFERLHNALDGE